MDFFEIGLLMFFALELGLWRYLSTEIRDTHCRPRHAVE
jgi:hypothetical protein